jgi:muramoyltetrapeptide carboxypeptidase
MLDGFFILIPFLFYFRTMNKPPPLRAGDKVGIIATGKKVFASDLEVAISTIASWGLQVETGSHLFSSEHQYLSSFDKNRRADLQGMISNPAIKAIICARGGYGTTRIMDQVDYSPLIANPKWIAGFSDVTALHLKLFTLNIASIHGTMPLLFSSPNAKTSIESLKNALFGFPDVIKAPPSKHNKIGTAMGIVAGGNLSLVADSIGTNSEPSLAGCILIVEEVDEHLYRIDRMLTHLKRAGKLNSIAAIIVGHMTDLKDTTPGFGETIYEIFLDKMEGSACPIAFNFPTGHENPNLAWQHGSKMSLIVDEAGSVLQPVG